MWKVINSSGDPTRLWREKGRVATEGAREGLGPTHAQGCARCVRFSLNATSQVSAMSPLHSQEAKAWSIATAVEESQKHLLRLASGTPTSSCRWSPFLVAICAGVPWCHRAPLWVITTVGRQGQCPCPSPDH